MLELFVTKRISLKTKAPWWKKRFMCNSVRAHGHRKQLFITRKKHSWEHSKLRTYHVSPIYSTWDCVLQNKDIVVPRLTSWKHSIENNHEPGLKWFLAPTMTHFVGFQISRCLPQISTCKYKYRVALFFRMNFLYTFQNLQVFPGFTS